MPLAPAIALPLVLSPVLLAVFGCMSVPARYRAPATTYAPRVERVTVAGFDRLAFFQTGGSQGYAAWGGRADSAAVATSPYAVGAAAGNARWGGSAGASSWSGDYRPITDVGLFKGLLENTRCVKVVEAGTPKAEGDALNLIGETFAEKRTGIPLALTNAPQVLSLVGIFGVPVHEGADGMARVRLYQGERFVRELRASARLLFWTTVYTFRAGRGTGGGDRASDGVARTCRLGGA